MNVLDLKKYFDPTTGRETDASVDAAQEAAVAQAISDAEALQTLDKNPGWKLLKRAIQADIDKYHEALLDLRDEKTILQTQEFVKARRQMLHWIEGKIQEGKELIEEKQMQAGSSDNL